ncbi:cytochrome-c peroxidase [Tropicimonas sp. IMCC34011]|uniref:cytochrome-c peroxidase n=1 Tax=Tropicimonas sp. IMCC34011 TaxID=2248759 RepID=UPI000E2742D7|nr:cytochrome c peroxidase [Tropicimonas sp. IMCC34011]
MHLLRAACLAACFGTTALAGPELPPPVTDEMFAPVNEAEARLGQLLFYDPILSGNRNISCATCHHPTFGTSDGTSLALGEGGIGLGPERVADPENLPEERVPRNAQALWNLGATEFTVLFHDGRIEVDESRPSGLRTPLEEEMAQGFASLLSAQTMFPVLSPDEMAGHYSENGVSEAVRQGRLTGEDGAWDRIAARVREIPEYQAMFEAADPEIAAGRPIGFTDISDMIAAFVAFEWRSDDSPFDRHLRGEAELDGAAGAGLQLFYGEAGCASCHSGPFQTDHDFHAMGVPQFGPGKSERFELHSRDLGRMRVTGDPEDAYAFRTPSLRNVELTAPYGHTGAYPDLATFVAAHADPATALASYDRTLAALPDLSHASDWDVLDSAEETGAIGAVLSPGTVLPEDEVAAITAFLESLTGDGASTGRLGIPESVPSGLPVQR